MKNAHIKLKSLLLCLTLLFTFPFVYGCNIETVDEHNEKVSEEADKRQEALSGLTSSADGSANNDTNSEYMLVHLKITCSKVLDNENLKTNADIPQNGIFFDNDIVVKRGSTVYDVLKVALEDNNMSMSGTSGYIRGICDLKEKECGRLSGWKFSINNEYPNVGCDGYTLSDNDNILWGYVADPHDTY